MACRYIFEEKKTARIKVWSDPGKTASPKMTDWAGFTFTGIKVNYGETKAAFAMPRPET